MKKLIALLLAVMMLFALCACGSNSSSSRSSSKSSSSSSSSSSKSSSSSNTYTAPVEYMEKYANAKSLDYTKYVSEAFNNIDGGNVSKMLKILAKSDTFKDYMDDFEENRADYYEDNVDEYGKNFKFTYKIDKNSKDKLDKDELRDCRDDLRDFGERIYEVAKERSSEKSSERKDSAEELGLSLNDYDKLLEYLEAFGKELKSATIDEGYELDVIETITGRELDEPEEYDFEMTVLKVNGRWVWLNQLDFSFYYYIIY